jgi:transposase
MASNEIALRLARGARRRVKRLSQVTCDKPICRWCQILSKLHEGWTVATIAEALNCHRSTIHRSRRRYEQVGQRSLIRRPSPGRPRKVMPKQDPALIRAAAKSPWALDQNFSNWTAAKLRNYLDWTAHALTVWRHLWAQGWRQRQPA